MIPVTWRYDMLLCTVYVQQHVILLKYVVHTFLLNSLRESELFFILDSLQYICYQFLIFKMKQLS